MVECQVPVATAVHAAVFVTLENHDFDFAALARMGYVCASLSFRWTLRHGQ